MYEVFKVKSKQELLSIIATSANDADLNYLGVSAVTDMSNIFHDSLFNGDISQWAKLPI